MLFNQPTLAGIRAGEITVAYRRWVTPRVRSGSRLRTRIGVLAVDSVDRVDDAALTDADARAAGLADRDALLAVLDDRAGRETYRIRLRLAGPDPREALRADAELSRADILDIDRRLARLDHFSTHGPWTKATLTLIDARPAVRAPDLAASLGRETQPFKTDVRKLKEIGLTESLTVGYRLSARGRAYLHLGRDTMHRI